MSLIRPTYRISLSRVLVGAIVLATPVRPFSTKSAATEPSSFPLFDGSGGTARVHIERSLPVNPSRAKEAWLSYHWERGAGLPVLVLPRDDKKKRVIAPVMMEEFVTQDEADEIRYEVTDFGLLGTELVEGSHSGRVRFASSADDEGSCVMTWDVTFEAQNRRALWEAVTNLNVGAASDSLSAYLATPLLYTRRTRIQAESVAAAVSEWEEFVFYAGGGLPFPPPVHMTEKGRIMRVPPFLLERLVSVDREKGEIRYTMENPSLFTYQVHSHAGRVRFVNVDEGELEMVWEVEIRPFNGWERIIRFFTAAVITTMARGFKVHLAEPGATVPIAPPRGKGDAFAEIPKDTWLGGVLSAHLSDRRSTMEQTVSMFQPWTWGRSTDDVGEGEEWGVGYLR